MDYIAVNYLKRKPKLNEPIFVEGLPGIGNVGKLAVEHLLDNINAVKFAELYRRIFPHKFLLTQMEQ